MKPDTDCRRVAVIEIGSSAVHLTIAERKNAEGGRWEPLEELTRGVRISKEIVADGIIHRETVDEVLSVLKLWRRSCEACQAGQIHTVVTSGVLEASNADIFLDNLRLYAGLDPQPLTPIQETAWLYVALTSLPGRQRMSSPAADDAPADPVPRVMLKVGAASSLLTVFDESLILAHLTLPLGLVRLRQIFDSMAQRETDFRSFLDASISHELRLLEEVLPVRRVAQVYGFGNELEALRGVLAPGAESKPFPREELTRFLGQTQDLGREGFSRTHGIPYDLTEHFHSACYLLDRVAAWFDGRTLELAPVTLRDGLVPRLDASAPDAAFQARIERQLHADAMAVGRAFRFDERHAATVAEYALRLFDLTQDVHRLEGRERRWLMAAALLHDVGYAISYSAHHKHSHYIINTRDFFFLSETERSIIALVARYHRKAGPRATHEDYERLPRPERMTVLKLASLLRLAEALDYSRARRIQSMEARREAGRLVLCCTAGGQLFGELYSFKEKKALFEELFGLRLSIETVEAHP